MTDSTDRSTRARFAPDSGSTVETLASRALGVLASKRLSAASLLSERFLEELSVAVRSGDGTHHRAIVRDMVEARIRPEDIADFYIPEVARRLGAAWCEDGLSFADVTIGTARLQGLLKEIGSHWTDDRRLDPDAPVVLVVVLADEFHTLGAMVLCGQLSRIGVSVKLAMGHAESDLLDSGGWALRRHPDLGRAERKACNVEETHRKDQDCIRPAHAGRDRRFGRYKSC